MKISTYENLKSSGSAWLGDIPKHWVTKKLKFLATVQPSNVDKKTVDGEEPVALCNYTDVYKNEYIDGRLEFMQASATEAEIKKFKVDIDDVIVTKDSETPDDIAVPACIAEDVEGLVCGYHLTQIKPIDLHGRYLFRLFQSKGFNAQFVVSANGVTRFGLPQHAIANAFTPLPPLEEQKTIARFLDFKTAQIDALIAKKKVLLGKLAEMRKALISHVITKGLNPTVPMKDSGVPWLGKIPAHWDTKRLKFCLSIQNGRDYKDVQATEGYPVYGSGGRFTFATQYLHDGEAVLLGRKGTIDRPLYVNEAFWTVDTMYYAIPIDGCNGRFAYYCATLIPFNFYSTDTALPSMTQSSLNNHVFAIPPINEQQEIVIHIDEVNRKIDLQVLKVTEVIARLTEYRSALITNAVTGKIDVRKSRLQSITNEISKIDTI